MRIVKAPGGYDQTNEQQFRTSAEQADDLNVKKGTDILLRGGKSSSRNPRIVFYSPSGDPFTIEIADDGTISSVAL